MIGVAEDGAGLQKRVANERPCPFGALAEGRRCALTVRVEAGQPVPREALGASPRGLLF